MRSACWSPGAPSLSLLLMAPLGRSGLDTLAFPALFLTHPHDLTEQAQWSGVCIYFSSFLVLVKM